MRRPLLCLYPEGSVSSTVFFFDPEKEDLSRVLITNERTYSTYLYFLFSKNGSSNETNLKNQLAGVWIDGAVLLLPAPTFHLKNTKLKLVVALLSGLRNFHRVARSRCWFLQFMVKFLDFEAAWTLP